MNNSNPESKFRKIPSTGFLYEINRDGTLIRNVESKKYHKQYMNRDGYWCVCLGRKRHSKNYKVHRLVAEVWIGPCPEGYEVDHINRIRDDNDFSNLRYVTHRENGQNSYHPLNAKHNIERLGHKVCVDGHVFDSFTQGAKELSCLLGGTPPANTIRYYFKQRRNYVHGHVISYPE